MKQSPEDKTRPQEDTPRPIADSYVRQPEQCIESALALRNQGNFMESLDALIRATELDPLNAEAHIQLGTVYEEGFGVAPDLDKAVACYMRAADRNNSVAQWKLGMVFANGDIVWRLSHDGKARTWFRRAAENGHADSQYRVAKGYLSEFASAEDLALAVLWLRKAADQGHIKAQRTLGWRYFLGNGVARDPTQAAHWFRRAAKQGDHTSQWKLEMMYKYGEGVKKHPRAAAAWSRAAERSSSAPLPAASCPPSRLLIERAKTTIEFSSGTHFNFGNNVEARSEHNASLLDAAKILRAAGYNVVKAGWGYKFDTIH